MQTVSDVIENQGRSALLPEAVISTILSQLDVKISYEPMSRPKVVLSLEETVKMNEENCIIIDNTVTGTCTGLVALDPMCSANAAMVKITSIPANVTSISGTLSTTNIIMANWSRAMWQSVFNRAVFECWHRVHLDRTSSRREALVGVKLILNCDVFKTSIFT
ncbi:hypothetical protein KIN20_037472 [Parelaphostrongylus tenuis]|uniref:Uncharacterized protein n=1 Tax=Parelaphostrongylus tenuis TaxID=148309 RepID=A0AAD5WM33_PARTN|nr:hypothetical protein KIN20_037472 [Parelaphostrongylus tenuis]